MLCSKITNIRCNIVLVFVCIFLHCTCALFDAKNEKQVDDLEIRKEKEKDFLSQSQILENQVIGCLFDKSLCNEQQRCVDDKLFGTCIPAFVDTYSFTYKLPKGVMTQLKLMLIGLLEHEYTWHDVYTQCIVRSSLISASTETEPDVTFCDEFARDNIEKRDELLNRKKYAYYQIDIPEKKDSVESEELQTPRRYEGDSVGSNDFMEDPGAYDDLVNEEEPVYDTIEDDVSSPSFPEDAITQEDSKIIGDLVDGRVTPSELSDSQVDRTIGLLARTLRLYDDSDDSLSNYAPLDKDNFDGNIGSNMEGPRELPSADKKMARFDWRAHVVKEFHKRNGNLDNGVVDARFLWIKFKKPDHVTHKHLDDFLLQFKRMTGIVLQVVSINDAENTVYFGIKPSPLLSSKDVISSLNNHTHDMHGFDIESDGLGRPGGQVVANALLGDTEDEKRRRLTTTMLVCAFVLAFICSLMVVFLVQRYRRSQARLQELTKGFDSSESQDYQDLCRQRITEKSVERAEPLSAGARAAAKTCSPNGSTGSWSDDPITTDMDITTGHIVLNYMEEYLSSKQKVEQEWSTLCSYEADQNTSNNGASPNNADKNRFTDLLPYDHTRVKLHPGNNDNSSDYINASSIYDSDPKVKGYIVAQSPLQNTLSDFWQMIWEMGVVVVVNLSPVPNSDADKKSIPNYWPTEGSKLYNQFEVHLVSEHIWCEDYLVRNFYLKNLSSGEARTVTMFHFLSWEEDGLPSTKGILEFRRKVNKSYKGKSSPILIHCSDGCGRSGTYCLLDMALTRISKGVKEIDLAATLEHLRDQRIGMVKTKTQFEFVITAIAEEVHSILQTLSQP